jgi:beta-D-xylosidase 4
LLAAAFDDELIERIGNIISTEARAFSNVGKGGVGFLVCFFFARLRVKC